jgi:hypothetical protein
MRLVAFEILSPYLYMHVKNIQIGGCTRLVHQFEGKVLLDSELERNMDIGHKHAK